MHGRLLMKRLEIEYLEFSDLHALDQPDQQLIQAAKKALEGSYSPYSKFQVGAAARLTNGTIVTGFNIENASYPVCLCAEQTTMSAVKTQHPGEHIESFAISVKSAHATVDEPATPCGKCRQLLSEQERVNGAPIRLILQGEIGPIWIFKRVNDLLPFSFTGEWL